VPGPRDAYDPTAYGAGFAEDYDATYDGVFDTEGAVDQLVSLAEGGPVLELGVGTGRIALALAARGVEVHGVEASPEMVDRLREKPHGADLPVVIGDFRTAEVPARCTVVALLVNTIYALPDQDAQVDVFANAARHLVPGGRFVVEGWVPDPTRFHRGEAVWPRRVRDDRVAIEVARHDPVAQRIEVVQVQFGPWGVRTHPANHRYAWPSELDLMARLAGLRLEHRWADWHRAPFTELSREHVSVYRLPPAPPAG
jgi:SAM-dependent methyltransferase